MGGSVPGGTEAPGEPDWRRMVAHLLAVLNHAVQSTFAVDTTMRAAMASPMAGDSPSGIPIDSLNSYFQTLLGQVTLRLCEGSGGEVTVSFTDSNGDGVLSVGDIVTITFERCADSEGNVRNGSLIVTLDGMPKGGTGLDALDGLDAAVQMDFDFTSPEGKDAQISGEVRMINGMNDPAAVGADIWIVRTGMMAPIGLRQMPAGERSDVSISLGLTVDTRNTEDPADDEVRIAGETSSQMATASFSGIGGAESGVRYEFLSQQPVIFRADRMGPSSGALRLQRGGGGWCVDLSVLEGGDPQNPSLQMRYDVECDGTPEQESMSTYVVIRF